MLLFPTLPAGLLTVNGLMGGKSYSVMLSFYLNTWIDGWVDGWMDGQMNDFFVIRNRKWIVWVSGQLSHKSI